jgi:acylphosphatase
LSGGAVRRRLLVSGRVQGVFYRDSCRRAADAAGVAGSAANLEDGRVEVVLEGGPHAVEQMIAWCRRGTNYAEVTGVEVIEEDPTGLSGFSIE